jgi:hypothetical protein
MEALADVEALPVQARLTIRVPYELVTVGSDWKAYRAALEHWIVNVSPTLEDGEYAVDMPNTDLKCEALTKTDRPHGTFLRRPAPEDDTLVQRVRQQIERKMKKVRRYKDEGHTTVLILETQDIALINQHKMLAAIREAVDGTMPEGSIRSVRRGWRLRVLRFYRGDNDGFRRPRLKRKAVAFKR